GSTWPIPAIFSSFVIRRLQVPRGLALNYAFLQFQWLLQREVSAYDAVIPTDDEILTQTSSPASPVSLGAFPSSVPASQTSATLVSAGLDQYHRPLPYNTQGKGVPLTAVPARDMPFSCLTAILVEEETRVFEASRPLATRPDHGQNV